MNKSNKSSSASETAILLGNNIVYFRQKYGYSQEKLSQLMNSDRGFLSKVENAQRSATIDYVDRLCKTFNIKPRELFEDRNFNLKTRVDSRK